MTVYKYEIIDRIPDKKKPHLSKNWLIIPMGWITSEIEDKRNYRWYVQAMREEQGLCRFYLLFGIDKFDSNCRKCHVDDYNRIKIKPTKELKAFLESELKYRADFDIEYVESDDFYDVFIIF